MIYSTATVPVNPEGEVPLTRAQIWAGLEIKARDARLFLPPGLCARCDVIEESAMHFVRDATIGGTDIREIITLERESKVTFFLAKGRSSTSFMRTIMARCSFASIATSACVGSSRGEMKNERNKQSSTVTWGIGPRYSQPSSAPGR
jgi:hypothetical protein